MGMSAATTDTLRGGMTLRSMILRSMTHRSTI